jgi:phospholipid-binding lipoprotein MlaA
MVAAGAVIGVASAACAAPEVIATVPTAAPVAPSVQPQAAPLADTPVSAEPEAAQATSGEAYDPWQKANRGLFKVGTGLDHAVVRPIAHGYVHVTSQPVRDRVSSVIFNLGEPSTAVEDLLQGHVGRAGRTTFRFAINSTVGLLGLFDVANKMGVRGHESDFGQTLGRYGAQPGPYVYVPLFGPSSVRDGVGRIVDVVTDPIGFVTGPITSTTGATRFAATAVDDRVHGEIAVRALKDATDPYVTTRSAFTQHRAAVVRRATGDADELPDFDTPPAPTR